MMVHRVLVSSSTSLNAPSRASSFCSSFPPGTSQQPMCSLNVAVTFFRRRYLSFLLMMIFTISSILNSFARVYIASVMSRSLERYMCILSYSLFFHQSDTCAPVPSVSIPRKFA